MTKYGNHAIKLIIDCLNLSKNPLTKHTKYEIIAIVIRTRPGHQLMQQSISAVFSVLKRLHFDVLVYIFSIENT